MTTHTTDTTSAPGPASAINTTQNERYLSAAAGAAFLLGALIKRGWMGLGLAAAGAKLVYRGVTGFSMTYKLLGKNRAVISDTAAVSVPHGAGIRVEQSITINRSPQIVYSFWRNFKNFPLFMENVRTVEVYDDRRSRWVVTGPAGTVVAWDAEIVTDDVNRHISWRSLSNADVDHAGTVHFRPAPGDRGTEVHIELEYAPKAHQLGAAIAKLFHSAPDQQIAADLYRLKQLMETGEIATVDGQTSGREPVETAPTP